MFDPSAMKNSGLSELVEDGPAEKPSIPRPVGPRQARTDRAGPHDARTSRRRSGDTAEQLVVEHLERAGYRVRDRNVHCRSGELDIVAERDTVLAFVEVRMRSTAVWGDPSLTITHAKQRKVVMSAHEYCQRHRLFSRVIRFDVASVVGRGRDGHVEYIEDAFDAGM